MTYRITGLSTDQFAPLFALDDTELAARGALRVTATADHGFPCRISLEDARTGDSLILLNYTSHDVATPFRSAYAIYVSEAAAQQADYIDETPPVFASRILSFRAFDADGMLKNAVVAEPGGADAAIRTLFADEQIAYIHAHNAAAGCFSARVERHGDA